ncbi:MAG: aldehyde ferredoxin oxidoreductase family protein [Phycisphaerae bacterium]|nr:aldehyde ferredoxin oxidoreductase family protein [Phycisphaerae bacterium]
MNGYMGRMLWVDLTAGTIEPMPLDGELREKYVGGYGIGARILVDKIPAGADPLGPENVLGFITGPYTATDAVVGSRYVVVGKSPLTGGWGDANSGGYFGPALKQGGVDAVFFTGISEKPVYLLVEEGEAKLCDASGLWGMSVSATEDRLKEDLGKDARAAVIGPAGEKLSRIAAIMNDYGRAAGRSGLGAVMGSKRLKAIVARGKAKVPVADPERLKGLRSKASKQIKDGTGFSSFYTATGTAGYTVIGAESGDSPVKNWKGAAGVDYEYPKEFTYEAQEPHIEKRWGCYRCPIVCSRMVKVKDGFYAGAKGHIPEYETQSAYGSNVVNYDYRSVVKANEICNDQGLDTISAGATVAFAIECFEAGILTEKDTDGLKLDWGAHQSIVKLTEMIAERRAIGDLLAEGPVLAAQKLGKGAEAFAIHAGGSPLPMHDPRFEPTLAVIYRTNASPGRHTQACQYLLAPNHPVKDMPMFGQGTDVQEGRGKYIRVATAMAHIFNCVGTCLFAYLSLEMDMLIEQLSAITGKEWTFDELVETGERIENVRQAFNWKHGIRPMEVEISDRAIGVPPLKEGPTAGVTVDIEKLTAEYFEDMGWDVGTGRPSVERLKRLGIEELAPAFG